MAIELLAEHYDEFKYADAGATVAKNFYVIGGKVCMALNDAGAGEENIFVRRCPRVRVSKNTPEAWDTPGTLIYLEAGGQEFTTVSTANTLAGAVAEVAASADAEGIIDLDPAA